MNAAIDRSAEVDACLAPPRMRAATFDDYPGIRRLASDHSVQLPDFEDWARRWQENPVWQRLNNPIGWVLQTERGEIVGSMESLPTLYRFQGCDLVSAATSLWCVKAPYRGFAVQLLAEYFSQSVDLFITTTASAAAIGTVSHFFDRVPVGRWDTVSCCIGHYRLFAEQTLEKLHAPCSAVLSYPFSAVLRCAQAVRVKPLTNAPRGVTIETVEYFDSRFDVLWNELARHKRDTLLAERSSYVLAWHFRQALRGQRLWVFTAARSGRLIGYCIFQEAHSRGFKRVRLVDYQSIDTDVALLPAFIRAAAQRSAREGFYILDHVGPGLPQMRAFDEYALYERPLGTWIFLFRASDEALDAKLHQPQFWEPSLYDGDATL